jgi:hypothetical protein
MRRAAIIDNADRSAPAPRNRADSSEQPVMRDRMPQIDLEPNHTDWRFSRGIADGCR